MVRRPSNGAASDLGPPPPEDAAWRAKRLKHQAYEQYITQLVQQLPLGMADGQHLEGAWAAAEEQLSYQIGVCDDWVQLAHLLSAFGLSVGPPATGLLCKRLAGAQWANVLAAQRTACLPDWRCMTDVVRHVRCTPSQTLVLGPPRTFRHPSNPGGTPTPSRAQPATPHTPSHHPLHPPHPCALRCARDLRPGHRQGAARAGSRRALRIPLLPAAALRPCVRSGAILRPSRRRRHCLRHSPPGCS